MQAFCGTGLLLAIYMPLDAGCGRHRGRGNEECGKMHQHAKTSRKGDIVTGERPGGAMIRGLLDINVLQMQDRVS